MVEVKNPVIVENRKSTYLTKSSSLTLLSKTTTTQSLQSPRLTLKLSTTKPQ